MQKGGFVYLMTNKNNTVLYIGVTSDLKTRVYDHKTGKYQNSFTHKYNIDKLVYFEVFTDINSAIAREKQLKGGSRKNKVDFIISKNPEWKDLFDEIM